MRKILIAFDGVHYSDTLLDFALKLHQNDPVMLAAAFIPQTSLSNLWSYAETVPSGKGFVPLLEQESADMIEQNINSFSSFCRAHKIEHKVHKDYYDLAITELKRESRFADMMLMCGESFYSSVPDGNGFAEDALHDIECPVVILPDQALFPSTNVLTYDGSAASVFAIKQFAYLLPECLNNETTLLCAENNDGDELPEEMNVEELTARHFPHLEFLTFKLDPKIYLNAWLMERRDPILVSGAYGGSGLYRLFHKSFVADIIRDHRMPVFVAHQ